MTPNEQRAFHNGVFATLREHDGVFCGTVRAFANVCARRFHGARPFEATLRTEGRLRALERDGAIRFTWGRSHNYTCVTAITLNAERTNDPQPLTRASAMEQEHRQRDLLTVLDELGGRATSISALGRAAFKQRAGMHRRATVAHDLRVLAHDHRIELRRARIAKGRFSMAVVITALGRQAIRERPPAADAPTNAASVPRRPHFFPLAAAILRTLAAHPDADCSNVDLRDTIITAGAVAAFPKARMTRQARANAVGIACRNLLAGGYVERTTHPRDLPAKFRITAKGLVAIGPPVAATPGTPAVAPHVPAPVLPDAPAPTTVTDGGAGTATDGVPEAIAALDRDIAAARHEMLELTIQMQGIGQRIKDVEARRNRLVAARGKLAAAYGVDTPPLPTTLPERPA